MHIKADDSRLLWQGVVSLEKKENGTIPWRIPYEDKDFYPDEELHLQASHASGVRLLFKTNSKKVKLEAKCLEKDRYSVPRECQVDLCIDNEIIQTVVFDKNKKAIFDILPSGEKVVELWFSPSYKINLKNIELDNDATLNKTCDKRLKWITYGSSITHCMQATSPAMTWPAIVARNKNLNLTSLGYAGQCKLDSMIARIIRDMDADFITLKLGINVYEDMSPRLFSAATIGTIAIIREKHKNTPMVVCSSIYSPPRETTPSRVNNTLRAMRDSIKRNVEFLQNRGDKNIYYVDGLNIFGPELVSYLPDELHPDAKGMQLLAKNFVQQVFNKYI
jgi:lysophospholipase L1-like esterase